MPGVDEIYDAHMGFACVLSVQATGILLQRSAPGDGHCQDQGIKGRVVKAFSD